MRSERMEITPDRRLAAAQATQQRTGQQASRGPVRRRPAVRPRPDSSSARVRRTTVSNAINPTIRPAITPTRQAVTPPMDVTMIGPVSARNEGLAEIDTASRARSTSARVERQAIADSEDRTVPPEIATIQISKQAAAPGGRSTAGSSTGRRIVAAQRFSRLPGAMVIGRSARRLDRLVAVVTQEQFLEGRGSGAQRPDPTRHQGRQGAVEFGVVDRRT